MRLKNQLIIFSLIVGVVSCKPPSYLPQPATFKDHVKGLYFVGVIRGSNRIKGEIICFDEDRLYILSREKGELKVVSKQNLKKGDVVVCTIHDKVNKFYKWTGLMSLSFLVHGFWSVFTLPINAGLSAQATRSTYRINYPKAVSWEGLNKFARFPQGLPEGIKLEDIR